MERADFGTTQRGHPVLFDGQGHAYIVGKKQGPFQNSQTYWRCARKNYGCKAKCRTKGNYILVKLDRHNHEPSDIARKSVKRPPVVEAKVESQT